MSKYDETLWIDHGGINRCPVDMKRKFEVRFRGGEVSSTGRGWFWGRGSVELASDIVAYRYTDTPTISKWKDISIPTEGTEEHTGGSSSYYTVEVAYPLNEDQEAYTAECEDIAEALHMTPAEYNVFKSTWRKAAARQGKKKKGNNAVYDAEKCVFYSGRMLVAAKREDV